MGRHRHVNGLCWDGIADVEGKSTTLALLSGPMEGSISSHVNYILRYVLAQLCFIYYCDVNIIMLKNTLYLFYLVGKGPCVGQKQCRQIRRLLGTGDRHWYPGARLLGSRQSAVVDLAGQMPGMPDRPTLKTHIRSVSQHGPYRRLFFGT